MSSNTDDTDENLTPPDILETATKLTNSLLPEKSRKAYDKCYQDFITWKMNKKLQHEPSENAPAPLRLTIDCGPEGKKSLHQSPLRRNQPSSSSFDVQSFCNLIHTAVPKTVKDGRFILIEPDMDLSPSSDTLSEVSIAPPKAFLHNLKLPKFRVPKLKIPNINVPKLRAVMERPHKAPKMGSPMLFPVRARETEELSSAERMEMFKKGVQKMLHVVKVLGQIDQYLSERTKIVIDKLAKTFSD